MRTLLLVKPEEADLAREIESRLLALPLASGVLFASVRVDLEEGMPPVYSVFIGCHRDLPEALMDPLVRSVLRSELEAGLRLKVRARRGISRSPVAPIA